MLKNFLVLSCIVGMAFSAFAQTPPADGTATPAAKPTEHVLGTISALDHEGHTITVKDDKTGSEYVVSVADTRTLLKVAPGAKDLHSAVRINVDDLAVADRVDVRGFKSDAPNAIAAKSVVLMSARDLAQKHQAELQAWANSTVGSVTSVDASIHSVSLSVNTAGEKKTFTIQTSPATEYTRYSPDNPQTAAASKFADIQPGDQLHILGQADSGAATVSAEKIYSAPVRTVALTITSVSPDGKQIVGKNLQTKQPETVLLTESSSLRKLPQQMAMFLARRFNPGAANAGGGSPGSQGPPAGAPPSNPSGNPYRTGNDPGGSGAPRGPADLSHMLDRIPPITAADLKPGDAIVIWGLAGHDPSSIVANTILAGVEPVLQSAPPRQGQSLDSDWGLNVAVPAQ